MCCARPPAPLAGPFVLNQHDPRGDRPLAKRPNYNFEKHRRELEKKRKKEEKRQRKLENTKRQSEEPAAPAPDQ